MLINSSAVSTKETQVNPKVAEASGLLTEVQVSAILNVSVSTLRRWRMLGKGPAYCKLPGSSLVRYDRHELLIYQERGRRATDYKGSIGISRPVRESSEA